MVLAESPSNKRTKTDWSPVKASRMNVVDTSEGTIMTMSGQDMPIAMAVEVEVEITVDEEIEITAIAETT
jgi:hypothetical protein